MLVHLLFTALVSGTVGLDQVPSSKATDELATEVGLPPNAKHNLTTEDDETFQGQDQMHPFRHCYQELVEQHSHSHCGLDFMQSMEAIGAQHWCSFDHIIGPYSRLSLCMEQLWTMLDCYYPNPSVQDFFLHMHTQFFLTCSEEMLLTDAPHGVVVVLTLGPVTIISLLVYLVVWKSNGRD